MKEKVGIQSGSPLKLSCKNCGAPVGFDIVRQTYRCSHCGELTGISGSAEGRLTLENVAKRKYKSRFSQESVGRMRLPFLWG